MIRTVLTRWLAMGALVAVAVVLASLKAYNAGYDKRDSEVLADIRAAETRARKAEQKGVKDMAALATRHYQEEVYAQAEIDRLGRELRAGARRLSIAVTRIPACADSAVAAGAGAETRAELDPEAAAALVAITSDGDRAIRERNRLIEAYEIAQEVCGK